MDIRPNPPRNTASHGTMARMTAPHPGADRAAARRSLEGLALGDAFGERWFPLFRERQRAYAEIRARITPPELEWHWTDDTAMALAIQRVLDERGAIDQDRLALCFALTYDADPARGYGHGMHMLLPALLAEPESWRTLAPGLFEGGSLGNGAAMRVAPLGAWFAADLDRVTEQAVLSAEVTHAHPQGIAGAVAIAVAAALSVRSELSVAAVAEATPRVRYGMAWRGRRSCRSPPSPGGRRICSATASGSGPTTPCRSRYGRRPATATIWPPRSGRRRRASATSTRPARSRRASSRPAPERARSLRSGGSAGRR